MEKYHFTKINKQECGYGLSLGMDDADGLKKSYTINISFLI